MSKRSRIDATLPTGATMNALRNVHRPVAITVAALERRALLTAVRGGDGTLTVTGTGGPDVITVDVTQGVDLPTTVTINGSVSSFNGLLIKREIINALGGNDTV